MSRVTASSALEITSESLPMPNIARRLRMNALAAQLYRQDGFTLLAMLVSLCSWLFFWFGD